MLPENFVEQQMRIYFRKNDHPSLEKAKRLVNAFLLQILQEKPVLPGVKLQ